MSVLAYTLAAIGGVLVSVSDSAWVEIPATVLLIVSGALATRSDIKRNPTA